MIDRYNNFSLKEYNTFGVEALAQQFVEYSTIEDVQMLYPLPDKFIHIGGGSNLLFVKDYDGVVFHSKIKGRTIVEETEEDIVVEVGAGEIWDEIVEWSVQQGYWGIENLSLIPGEVGAAAVQNIGAYGAEIEQVIDYVELCTENGKVERWSREKMRYAYRYSILKEPTKKHNIVVRVGLRLSKTYAPILTYRALKNELEHRGVDMQCLTSDFVRLVVIDIRRSKLPEVKEVGSAGSFFMNPIVSREFFDHLCLDYPEIPYYKIDENHYKIPAGWLVDQAGWKGFREGDTGVYPKQALVLVNWGKATGEEIAQLSRKIQKDIKEKFNIELKSEVLFVE